MRGAGDATKRRALFQYHRNNCDLLILQETHSCKEYENIWKAEWGGDIIFAHGTTQARGVAVLMVKGMRNSITNVYTDEGRTIIFDIQQNEQKFTIVAVYAPNDDCPVYFENIRNILRNRGEQKILVGDFNLVLDVALDRKDTYHNNNKAKEVVEDLMEEFCLKEIWRIRNGEDKEYSWFKRGNIQKASRIDFMLVSAGLDQKVEYITYISSIKTDHRAIYCVIKIYQYERGVGYWKFNNKLLQDKQFLDLMNVELENCYQSSGQKSPIMRWEIIKRRIKKVATKYARAKVSEENLVIANLSEKVNEYETRFPLTEEEDKLYTQTKLDLEEKIMDKTRASMFRSKVQWFEEGEKNTKYFFALEKARYNAKTCYKIIGQDDQEIEEPSEILKVQHSYYQTLYEEDKHVQFNLQNTYGLYVPEHIKLQQDQQLQIQDYEEAIKKMNNNKTPGQDGIPVDFYKVFWSKLKVPFNLMAMENYKNGVLHDTARQGILNLIPKANKDTRYVKNLRPITLLNTDYKIIEKAIANKMLPALEHLIHKDQRGFMKDRRISVNIRKMLDIMHYADREDLEAVVLSLDFVKCFDKCSFSILHGSLDFFGFGNIVKAWTKILYKDYQVKIQNNGYFSQLINIQKGVHQGGCCSSVYFLVIAEILALALRENKEIDAITVQDIRNLLNQFADDMDICSFANKKSLTAIFNQLESFRLQSGFQLSYDKTTLYRIGSLKHSSAKLYEISQVKWSNQDIQVLGVTIAHEDIVNKNYQNIVEKSKHILNSWKNRGFCLLGKVQVVNTLIASLFVHKMMVLPTIPMSIVKNMDNMRAPRI